MNPGFLSTRGTKRVETTSNVKVHSQWRPDNRRNAMILALFDPKELGLRKLVVPPTALVFEISTVFINRVIWRRTLISENLKKKRIESLKRQILFFCFCFLFLFSDSWFVCFFQLLLLFFCICANIK